MSENKGKRITLVTGANKSIGFEVARQLAERGDTVLIGARNEERGREAEDKLKAEGFDAHFVHLDVEDAETHQTAAKFVAEKFGKLDVLVNNAGIALDANFKASTVPQDLLRKTFDTNFFGVIALTQALLPLLKKSDAGRIVNVSSGLGSLTLHGDPEWEFYDVKLLAYNSSKTALNAFTVMLAHELKDTNIKVNSADPGFTATDLNGHSGYKTVEQGASVIVDLATLPDDGATGSYFDDKGVVPW
ncbi:MAG: SDR family oxidoreductase [Pyrinomonadaceae bacterium]|nr:SDR family oxidoreductase [Pyrinomonadaceae bacterium]